LNCAAARNDHRRATYEQDGNVGDVGRERERRVRGGHVGMVLSGRATAAMDDGRVIEMKAGRVLHRAGHDSWV